MKRNLLFIDFNMVGLKAMVFNNCSMTFCAKVLLTPDFFTASWMPVLPLWLNTACRNSVCSALQCCIATAVASQSSDHCHSAGAGGTLPETNPGANSNKNRCL